MNFSLREFVKKGYLESIGKLPDYQIRQECLKWYDKGILTLEDLEEINQAIEDSHKPQLEPEPTPEPELKDEVVEEEQPVEEQPVEENYKIDEEY